MGYKKALLINPPTGKMVREDRCQADIEKMNNGVLRTPIDLIYEAATLQKDGVECRVRDYPAMDLGWDAYKKDLAEFRPELVVISITTPTLPKDLQAVTMAKEADPKIFTVAKGAHFLADDKTCFDMCPALDAVARGEAEEIIGDLSKETDLSKITGLTYRKNGSIEHNPSRPLKNDLDNLPFPARNLIDNTLYIRPDTGRPQTTIITSRGCPYECIYCLAPVVSGSKLRIRSPKNVVDEVEECVAKHHIRDFLFLADTFTLKKDWTIAVCQEIINRKLKIRWCANSRATSLDEERAQWMKKAGCWLIAFGIESGSQELLDKMKKSLKLDESRRAIAICRKFSIKSYAYFIFGLPWETKETADQTIQFAKSINANFTEFYTAYPFPGTEFHEIALKQNLFNPADLVGNSYTGYESTMIRSQHLDQKELVEIMKKAAREFYFRPAYIAQTFMGIRSFVELKNYLIYGARTAFRFLQNKKTPESVEKTPVTAL